MSGVLWARITCIATRVLLCRYTLMQPPEPRRIERRLASRLVRLVARLAPAHRRERWREEWLGEIEAGVDSRPGLLRRSLGAPRDALALRGELRRIRAGAWRAGWRTDALHAIRACRRDPWHAGAVSLCLGLGVAASLGTFAFVNALLYGPIPGVVDRASLATVYMGEAFGRGSIYRAIPPDEFERLRDSGLPIELAAEGIVDVGARFGDGLRAIKVAFVSGNYFSLLGTRAAEGRLLGPSDDRPGSFVAVASAGFSAAHFASQASARGDTLVVAGQPVGIIGVAEAGFAGAGFRSPVHEHHEAIDLWLPLSARGAWPEPESAGRLYVDVVTRLPDGMSNEQAVNLLDPVMARLSTDPRRGRFAHVGALGHPRDATPAETVTFVAAMLSAPFIVVLIACANVANLRLARSTARARELAVRLALGATRTQLARLLVVESFVLAVGATIVGWLGAELALAVLGRFVAIAVEVDVGTVMFTVLLMGSVTLLAGLAPAFLATRRLMHVGLKQTVQAAGPPHSRFRSIMVGSQVALSLGLLVIAALFGRAIQQMIGVQAPGLDRLVVADIDLSRLGYESPAAHRLARDLVDRLAAGGQVQAGLSDTDLFPRSHTSYLLPAETQARRAARLVSVTPDWFAAVGTRAVRGRIFDASDARMPVVLVDRRLASRISRVGAVVGETIRLGIFGSEGEPVPVSIVGVIDSPVEPPTVRVPDPVIYLPLSDRRLDGRPFPTRFTLVARGPDATRTSQAISRLLSDLEPRAPWTNIETAAGILSREMRLQQSAAAAIGALGLIALLLAATGLYASIAYAVSLRSREIGIRLAIGARPSDAARLIVRQSLAVTAAGILGGLLLTVPIAYIMRSAFVGISFVDPLALVPAVLVLAATAFTAALVPAGRAARVDPVRVLRAE